MSLCRGSEIFTDVHPEELEEAMNKATDFVVTCREDHLACQTPYEREYFWGWMNWWFPGPGPCLGDDQLGNCGPAAYERFSYPYHQKLLDHFNGGWYHLHSKDLFLLPQLSKLKKLKCLEISDDPNSKERGFTSIDRIRKYFPDTPLRICCLPEEFVAGLINNSLPGNIIYYVSEKNYAAVKRWSISEANEILKKREI